MPLKDDDNDMVLSCSPRSDRGMVQARKAPWWSYIFLKHSSPMLAWFLP